jgi:anti-anti-sigma factor
MTAPLEREALREHFDISIDVHAREIGLVGELDMATAPLLLAAATTFLAELPGPLMLDLAGVTFADSSLLSVIDAIRADLTEDLWLTNASAAVKRLFLASGATGLLR